MKYLLLILASITTILSACNNPSTEDKYELKEITQEETTTKTKIETTPIIEQNATALETAEFTSEETNNSASQERCLFNTLGTTKISGIEVQFPYPCNWEESSAQEKHIIKKFTARSSEDELINGMLVIIDTKRNLGQEKTDSLLMPEQLKANLKKAKGQYISSRNLQISGFNAAELVYDPDMSKFQYEFYMRTVQYILFYQNYLIRLQYTTGGTNKATAAKLFNENKGLFQELATTTRIGH